MIKIINKAYLIIIFLSVWGLYQRYEEVETEKESFNGQISAVQAQLNKSKRDKKKIEDFLKNIEIKKAEVEEVALQVEKLQAKLPQELSDSETVGKVRNIADRLKIRDIRVNPAEEADKGFYFAKNYEIEATGTYLQFLLLLEGLSDSERILNVKNIKIERNATQSKGRYEIIKITAIIESYRYNPSYRENRGIEEIEKRFEEEAKKKAAPARKKRGKS
ncbi:type 4a pilus biogenesis protein PilO [Bacteriovorax sp. Seq25_V]|uniref:type 4a pilus biogenesis protein PilO n=1 Tax=Bacteriovorax sp. Seq25_V TaxID=1201288 RepID=UPI00038A5029|nr:type 4a pilus biogenesis protein PilO [Bacteriovorax sp. Seq25_V]EQC43288.1 pilus assembly protein, PilO [Bacteriovorax sp. Seq25_V]